MLSPKKRVPCPSRVLCERAGLLARARCAEVLRWESLDAPGSRPLFGREPGLRNALSAVLFS